MDTSQSHWATMGTEFIYFWPEKKKKMFGIHFDKRLVLITKNRYLKLMTLLISMKKKMQKSRVIEIPWKAWVLTIQRPFTQNTEMPPLYFHSGSPEGLRHLALCRGGNLTLRITGWCLTLCSFKKIFFYKGNWGKKSEFNCKSTWKYEENSCLFDVKFVMLRTI